MVAILQMPKQLKIASRDLVSFSVGALVKSVVNNLILYPLKALITELLLTLLRITPKKATQECLKGRPLTTQTGHSSFNYYYERA